MMCMNDVKQRLFYNTLRESVGDYFIQNLARGQMGDRIK